MLTSLITLKLSENKIETLPSNLATITTLESLILDKNRIVQSRELWVCVTYK
jgi:Leucine-rich repeat (LRR) protein